MSNAHLPASHDSILTIAGSLPAEGAANHPTVNDDHTNLKDPATADSVSVATEDAASGITRAPLADSPSALTLSPVISRDFANAMHSARSRSEPRLAPENDMNEKIEVIKEAPAGTVQGAAAPMGPTIGNPRLKALKALVRSSSEPAPAKRAPETDIEKGITTAAEAPKVPNRLAGLLEPEKPLKPPPTYKTSFMNILKYSWINVLLVFIPVAFAVNNVEVSDTAKFLTAFGAIIPLAALLGFATEELALRVGPTLGGLMNATLGNTVELIIAIIALTKGELRVVQSSMIGSILSNCLLVLGCCFFAGGIRFHEQIYTVRSAQLHIGMLGISALVVILPAAFHVAVEELGPTQATLASGDLLKISRGVAFILLVVYACYLFFQLWTHAYLYSAKMPITKRSLQRATTMADNDEPQPPLEQSVLRIRSWRSSNSSHDSDADSINSSSSSSSDSDEGGETPKLKVGAGIALIVCVTVLTGLLAEYLVSSIDGLASSGGISKEFIALILLPIVGNVAEHVTAVTVSVKDKLDLSMAVAVGSSIQIALFVLPLLVLLGWAIGQPLSLQFDVLEVICLFISIVIVNQAISDGKTNWLEGLSLITAYLIIGLVFFFYPGSDVDGTVLV